MAYIDCLETVVKGIDKSDDVVLTHESKLILILEPENKFDPNAIKVCHEGKKTGYIPKKLAQYITPIFKDVKIHCQIMGQDPSLSPTWYRVNLYFYELDVVTTTTQFDKQASIKKLLTDIKRDASNLC